MPSADAQKQALSFENKIYKESSSRVRLPSPYLIVLVCDDLSSLLQI